MNGLESDARLLPHFVILSRRRRIPATRKAKQDASRRFFASLRMTMKTQFPKLITIVALAAAAALAMAGCTQTQSSQAESSTGSRNLTNAQAIIVTADDVAALEEGAYLVDTRTYEEYVEGHIPGALNASYPKSTGGPCQTDENSASFRNAWAKLDIPKDAHVVVYCRTGVRASAAASALAEDGYTNVELYEGSWTDWTSDPSRPIEVI